MDVNCTNDLLVAALKADKISVVLGYMRDIALIILVALASFVVKEIFYV